MAGCSVADFNDIFTFWFKRKIFIKRGDAVGLCLRHSDLSGDISQQLSRQIAIFRLDILHYGNQRTGLFAIPFNDSVCHIVI